MESGAGRLDRRKIKIATRGVLDRRRHRRMPLTLPGRFLDHEGEQRCRLVDVSPGGAKIVAKRPPASGAMVVLLIDGLGRIEGEVKRTGGNWFSLRFNAPARKRDKLADAITWRYNMERLGLDEDRGAARRPGRGQARIRLRDGVVIRADVMDVSITGAAFACLERPRVGEAVKVGEMTGVVARILENGFAVAFDPPSAATSEPNHVEPADGVSDPVEAAAQRRAS